MLSNIPNLRSQGCHACIRRKVKCDQQRPGCFRCIRRRQVCPGYRTWDDLVLRNCSVIAVAHDSWKQEALPCFLAFHTTAKTRVSEGHMDFILEMVASELHTSDCFRDAIMAAATACLARHAKNRYPTLKIEATNLYGKALRSLHTAMIGQQSIGSDSTLAAVILMSTAGTIAGIAPTAISPHHRAEIAIASLRTTGSHDDQSRAGRMVNFVRLTAAKRSMFFPKISHPYSLPNDQASGDLQDFRNVLFHLSHAFTSLRDAMSSQSQNAPAVARRVLHLATYMQSFVKPFPPDLRWADTRYDGKLAYVFDNYSIAGMWLSLWCAQVRLMEALRSYLSTSPDREFSEDFNAIITVEDSRSPIRHICASVPFLLGKIDSTGNSIPADRTPANPGPLFLSSALFVIGDAVYPGISQKERSWVTDQLSYIGHERGIGLALLFRNDLLSAHLGSDLVNVTLPSLVHGEAKCCIKRL